MDIVGIIIAWLMTSVSLFIISKLRLGVEIDSFEKAMISAAVFGVLNVLLDPIFQILARLISIFQILATPSIILTLGLFAIVVNAMLFGLAAWLVSGFRLAWGFWSALLPGAIALIFFNSVLYHLFDKIL